MTAFLILVAMATVGLHAGGFTLGTSVITAAIGVGVLMMVIGGRRRSADKVVMVQDLTTGETKYQPMDAATRRYLNTRGAEGNGNGKGRGNN